MRIPNIEIAFSILKSVGKEIKVWENQGLDETEDKDVYNVISMLRLFLEIKRGGEKNGKDIGS